MAGLLNRAMSYIADSFKEPLIYTGDTYAYSDLSVANGWTAPYTGIAIFAITPSNTSQAYAYLRDITNNMPVASLSVTGGYSVSTAAPIVKGIKYRVTSATSNVTSGTRCGIQLIKLMGGVLLNLNPRREAVAA